MDNPLGIMNYAKYNYFAHIRSILFPDREVPLAIRINEEKYKRAYEAVKKERQNLQEELMHLKASYTPGNGFDAIPFKIAMDNLYLKINAMSEEVEEVHIKILNEFIIRKRSISFSKLIEVGAYPGYEGPTQEQRERIKELKESFNGPYLVLLNNTL